MSKANVDSWLQCWQTAKEVHHGLLHLIEQPEDEQAATDTYTQFQTLAPYLSTDVNTFIHHVFAGEEFSGTELQETAQNLLSEAGTAVCKALLERLSSSSYIEESEAEKLFSFWDDIPHTSVAAYQFILDLCEKTSISMPMKAFEYTLRLFAEQPGILSGEKMGHPGYIYQPSEQRTFTHCPICGGDGTPYYRAFSYCMSDFGHPHLPVKLWMKCGGCGNLYTWKYPEEMLTTSGGGTWVTPNPSRHLDTVEETNGAILAIWSDILRKLHAYSGGKSLLEVGIGRGELLAVALEMGYQADGVEIVPTSARKVADMLGIPVWCGDFLEYASDKTYSVITMGDVIEHVTDPEKALRLAHRLLAPDGVLWVSTPNFESSFSRMRKFNDPMWLEPYHITYFSRTGLENLARKCGFSLQEYRTSQRYNGSMELIFVKEQLGIGVQDR